MRENVFLVGIVRRVKYSGRAGRAAVKRFVLPLLCLSKETNAYSDAASVYINTNVSRPKLMCPLRLAYVSLDLEMLALHLQPRIIALILFDAFHLGSV